MNEAQNILTEEELQEIEAVYDLQYEEIAKGMPRLVKLIASHRSLLSANVALNEENQKVKDDYNALVSIIDRARKLAFLAEVEPK